MKHKAISRIFAVLLAALILTGGLSVTAYAETPTETPTDDSGVKVDPKPLTPEGNMTLVDDIQGDAAKDKQFIVVQSRGGNYFYIVIDNAADGENRVHFLNQVDEADLLSIIDEDLQSVQQQTTPPVIEQPTQITEPEPTTQPEKPKENNPLYGLILFLLVAVLGGGGAIFYFKVIKPKQSVKGGTDLDDFDLEEWEDDEPEEDTDDGIEYVDLDNGQEDEE